MQWLTEHPQNTIHDQKIKHLRMGARKPTEGAKTISRLSNPILRRVLIKNEGYFQIKKLSKVVKLDSGFTGWQQEHRKKF